MLIRSLFVVPMVGVLVAAETPVPSTSTGNPLIDALITLGAFGIVMALAAVGYVWFKPGVDQLKASNATLQASNDRLIGTYEKDVIPALQDALRVMMDSTRAVEASNAAMRELTSEVSSLRATVSAQSAQIVALGGGSP